jgi:predicted Zn-dependent protease with MMP-like domain
MVEIGDDEFEAMVAGAVDALPEQYRDQIANVAFAVEEWAQPGDYALRGLPRGSTLLGVYRGIPLTQRGRGYNMVLPDTIVIFRGPLVRLARDLADLEERVAHVVRHEVAHYFGISDERLREIGAY